jgi:hypothetical protein
MADFFWPVSPSSFDDPARRASTDMESRSERNDGHSFLTVQAKQFSPLFAGQSLGMAEGLTFGHCISLF